MPFWSFGHGLSYTTFQYSGLSFSKSTLSANDTLVVSVNVKNTGTLSGQEVVQVGSEFHAVPTLVADDLDVRDVQVYMTDLFSSVVTPVQSLQGFAKVDLAAGQSQTVSVSIPIQNLAVWTLNNSFAVESGQFTVQVGTSQAVYVNGTITVQ